MDLFSTKLSDVNTDRPTAVQGDREKQAWNEQSRMIIGIAEGQNMQTRSTVIWYIRQVSRFLKFKFKGNEEQMSLWGFDVVVTETSGRRNVRVNIPRGSADGLLILSAAIISKHTLDAGSSILIPSIVDMVDFEAKHNQAFHFEKMRKRRMRKNRP